MSASVVCTSLVEGAKSLSGPGLLDLLAVVRDPVVDGVALVDLYVGAVRVAASSRPSIVSISILR
ncbi:hypothetical protein [Paractinoplanes atraurantiacus]|uniref:hypothetical protein n=1 Tax=Paractinoplanes atraurantiacus TaxID=1036182 RepID=UPI0015CF318E|nr:hypothetical protein [Actinoplanes atraurantiacus]